MNRVAMRYGEALFSLSLERGTILLWQKELKEFIHVIKENEEIINILSSGFYDTKKRIKIAREIFQFNDTTLDDFLSVIIQNNRFSFIEDIINSFNSLCNNHQGISEGIVYSVYPLSRQEIELIEQKVSKLENIKVELFNRIDKNLIGGLKIVINNKVYDDSIARHIESMKTSLLK